jgi:molybdate transport system substrate-binding protein
LTLRYPDIDGWNIVSNEVNVLQVVTRVRLGEADAGIVYETDVTPEIAAEVREIPIPDQFNVAVEYPIAAVVDGNAGLANDFISFVQSAEGTRILSGWGFQPAGS